MSVEFVIPTWERPDKLMVMLSSLVVQTNPNWKAHVVIDGLTNDYFNVKEYFQNHPNIRFSHITGPNNDWGHTARNYGLSEAQEEWVVMTGDDNYYVPVFVDVMMKEAISNGADFVFCDFVHNLIHPGGYQYVNSRIAHGAIDIGSFMSRTRLAQEIKLESNYDADWEFVSEFCKRNKKSNKSIIKVDKVLYIHN